MPAKKISPETVKYLELIQGVVTRMNNNSFQMKGWMTALVSALLAVYASAGNDRFVLVAMLPAVLFWFLDAYYLQQERKFRGLYNDAAGLSKEPQKIELFAMRPDLYQGGKYSFWDAFGSATILPFYLSVIALLALVYFAL